MVQQDTRFKTKKRRTLVGCAFLALFYYFINIIFMTYEFPPE